MIGSVVQPEPRTPVAYGLMDVLNPSRVPDGSAAATLHARATLPTAAPATKRFARIPLSSPVELRRPARRPAARRVAPKGRTRATDPRGSVTGVRPRRGLRLRHFSTAVLSETSARWTSVSAD